MLKKPKPKKDDEEEEMPEELVAEIKSISNLSELVQRCNECPETMQC